MNRILEISFISEKMFLLRAPVLRSFSSALVFCGEIKMRINNKQTSTDNSSGKLISTGLIRSLRFVHSNVSSVKIISAMINVGIDAIFKRKASCRLHFVWKFSADTKFVLRLKAQERQRERERGRKCGKSENEKLIKAASHTQTHKSRFSFKSNFSNH